MSTQIDHGQNEPASSARTISLSSSMIRLVLFGLPSAGKTTLLGALAQAAQTQPHVLDGTLTDLSRGLTLVRQHVYEGQPPGTIEEIISYPIAYEPLAQPGRTAPRIDAVLLDCSGEVANEILAGRRTLAGTRRQGRLAHAVIEADCLLLAVDASVDAASLDQDFTQFARFLQLLRQQRGQVAQVSGLPVFLVLTKCDLIAQPGDDLVKWLDRIEQGKVRVAQRFKEFLARRQTDLANDPAPFGRLDLHVWATAAKRPELVGSPAKPREPYGVAELFRQGLAAAMQYRQLKRQSQRRLALVLGASLGFLTLLGAAGTGLYFLRDSRLPGALEVQVDRLLAREREQSAAIRHRDVQAKIDETTGLLNDPHFGSLPPDKQEALRQRLQRLEAYRTFEGQLARIRDPRDATTLEQVKEIREAILLLPLTADQRSAWNQTEALRRYDDSLTDTEALPPVVEQVEGWYRRLIAEGERVLDNAGAANLPARAKQVLDEAKAAPFPENSPAKLVPGGRRASYATVFAIGTVSDQRQRWDRVRKKLEPYARLEGA